MMCPVCLIVWMAELLEELSDDATNNLTEDEMLLNLVRWEAASSWVKWWSGDEVRVMLCEAYRTISDVDWTTDLM